MAAEHRGPNLIFLLADQMREMDMGCSGNSQIRTPTLDRLAYEGMRLTHCYATTPVCGPNRSVLLTGTYPTTTGVVVNDLPLPLHLPTIGSLLRDHGYRTGYIGKWHLDGVPRSGFTPPGERRHGFEYWAAHNCFHDYFHPRYYLDTPDLIERPGYEPVVQTDLALEFLERQQEDVPFFLFVSWGPPHDPYDLVPADYRALYDPSSLQLRPNVVPEIDNSLAAGMDCRRVTADYYAAITALDDQVARVMDGLERQRVVDNTVLIFTSDHGDMLWSHGLMKKQTPYEEAIRVPFLIRWPERIAAGKTSDLLMGTVDLLPTILGLLDLTIPEGIEGRDLSAGLTGAERVGPDSLLIANYSTSDEAVHQQMPEWRGVRTHRYTYIERIGRVPWMLFDNLTDPFQTTNLIGSPEVTAMERALAAKLSEWLLKTSDPFLSEREMVAAVGMTADWERRMISVE